MKYVNDEIRKTVRIKRLDKIKKTLVLFLCLLIVILVMVLIGKGANYAYDVASNFFKN